MQTTTDLSTVRAMPRAFSWGPVRKVHDVGRYTLVEYQPRDAPADERAFHIYVDEKSTGLSTTTLEEGLIFAIAYGKLEDKDAARWMTMAAVKVLFHKSF